MTTVRCEHRPVGRAVPQERLPRRGDPSRGAPAPASAGRPKSAILQLQRTAGNAAVGAVLARRFDRAAYEKSMEAKRYFMAWRYEELSHRPTTGGGNFDSLYEPKKGTLTITVKCKFSFDAGSESDWEDAEPEEGGPAWDPKAMQAWKDEFTRRVSAFWSDRFVFYCTRPWWEDLEARVKVNFVAVRDKNDAHYVVHVKKIPEMEDRRSKVRRPKKHGKRGVAFLDSEDLVNYEGQTPAYHEAGHMLGLGDEYPKKKKPNEPVTHGKLVQAEYGHPVRRARDERLMASGNRIDPEHGVTILEALELVTGEPWSHKRRTPAPVLSDPVDGPLPAKPDPLAPSTGLA
jgi:hypothetical protein